MDDEQKRVEAEQALFEQKAAHVDLAWRARRTEDSARVDAYRMIVKGATAEEAAAAYHARLDDIRRELQAEEDALTRKQDEIEGGADG